MSTRISNFFEFFATEISDSQNAPETAVAASPRAAAQPFRVPPADIHARAIYGCGKRLVRSRIPAPLRSHVWRHADAGEAFDAVSAGEGQRTSEVGFVDFGGRGGQLSRQHNFGSGLGKKSPA